MASWSCSTHNAGTEPSVEHDMSMTRTSCRRRADDHRFIVTGVVMSEFGAVALDAQIAPWSEPLSCSMAGAEYGETRQHFCRVFCSICKRVRNAVKTQNRFLHASWCDACVRIELAFDGIAADGRKSYKTLARTAGKYECFY